jgi:S1-C subfamily serine protease
MRIEGPMYRSLVLAIVVLMTPPAEAQLNVLHISVSIVDQNGQPMPVPRFRLQVSDNPATALPRRLITSLDGKVDIRLAPGNYSVESEKPLISGGKSYQWSVTVDVVLGRDAKIELTGTNAEVAEATDSSGSTAAATIEADPSTLLGRWQDSVVAIWTATAHGSGVLIDSSGLIAADQQVIGTSSSVEVQLSPAVKVEGSVVASDAMRGIALIRIAPSIASAAKALPLECDTTPETLTVGQLITALEAPLNRRRDTRVGAIESVLANFIDTDLVASDSGSGGPVFAPSGRLIGLTTLVRESSDRPSNRARAIRTKRVCEFLDSAAEKIKSTPAPTATQLPVEPANAGLADAATVPAKASTSNVTLYRVATDNFTIEFITPNRLMAARDKPPSAPPGQLDPLSEFSNWTEYVDGLPPVLLVRVTPKFAEGFWTKIGRGVAMTQGVSIPSIKRPTGDFGSMRARCGDTEIIPVHPFKLEHKLSEKDTLIEGLYAFDPGALTPACAAVTLHVFSEKDPRKPEAIVVNPKVLERVSQDFRR